MEEMSFEVRRRKCNQDQTCGSGGSCQTGFCRRTGRAQGRDRIQADPRTDSAVPLLYLQRAGDHPAACPPGRRQSTGNNGRRQHYPGHQFGLRGLSDLQLHRDRELPELSGQGLHQRLPFRRDRSGTPPFTHRSVKVQGVRQVCGGLSVQRHRASSEAVQVQLSGRRHLIR